jgi:hypothetical protein
MTTTFELNAVHIFYETIKVKYLIIQEIFLSAIKFPPSFGTV